MCAHDRVSAKMYSLLFRYTNLISYFCKLINIPFNLGGVFCTGFFIIASNAPMLYDPSVLSFFPIYKYNSMFIYCIRFFIIEQLYCKFNCKTIKRKTIAVLVTFESWLFSKFLIMNHQC